MEAAQLDPRRTRKRRCRRIAALHFGLGSTFPRPGASAFHRTESAYWLRHRWHLGGRPLGSPHALCLRRGGLFSEIEVSLDVVARDWRPRDWPWRLDFPASARRRI